MKRFITICAAAAIVLIACLPVSAVVVGGNPETDAGWTLMGNSLENGIYVDGSANYGFNAYGAGFTVQAGSNLEISDGTYSWQAGDMVVGVGGKFQSITAGDAGWSAFSGNAVNSRLSTATGPKLQAKFGTSAASWYTSTVAPGSGNGGGSGSLGGGRVQIRTSAYFSAATWDTYADTLMLLDKNDHIEWTGGAIDKRVARVMWTFDDVTQEVASWELLLNVSLMDRVTGYAGLLPGIGDMAIMTVQDGDNSYTNALVNTVPEPTSMAILAIGSVMLMIRRRRRE